MIHFHLISLGDAQSITVLLNGQIYVAASTHPNFDAIVRQAQEGEEEGLAELFDATHALNQRFERLSERVLVRHGQILFDGDPVDSALTQTVIRFWKEGLDFMPLVHFFEKIMGSPSAHSRAQLYNWLRRHRFSLFPDGDIVAYKSVYNKGDGVFHSVQEGTAIVDGKVVTGHIPNEVGSIIEMARSSVTFDPSVGCAQGLHAGTFRYAKTFSGDTILVVKVNPRDVVSVPSDSNEQKLRVCRYKVIEVVTEEHEGALKLEPEPGDDPFVDELDEDEDDLSLEYEDEDEDEDEDDW